MFAFSTKFDANLKIINISRKKILSKKNITNGISVDSSVNIYAKNIIIPMSSKTVVFDKRN